MAAKILYPVLFLILVLKEFTDKEDAKHLLRPGDVLKTPDIDRVNNILAMGLGKIQGVEPVEQGNAGSGDGDSAKVVSVGENEYELSKVISALNEIGVKTAGNTGVAKVSEKVAELDESQVAELIGKLSE